MGKLQDVDPQQPVPELPSVAQVQDLRDTVGEVTALLPELREVADIIGRLMKLHESGMLAELVHGVRDVTETGVVEQYGPEQ